MWKNVLLHVAPEYVAGALGSAAYATNLAAATKAELTGLAFAYRIPAPFGLRTGVDLSVIERQEEALKRDAEGAMTAVEKLAREKSVAFGTRIENCLGADGPSTFAQYARLHDVTVIGPGDDASGESRELLEAALFQSGRPVIVTPVRGVETFKCERVALAWNDSPQASRALADAMPLLKKAKSVHVVSVTDDDTLGAIMPSIEVAKYLALHGIETTVDDTVAGSRSIEHAIIGKSEEVGADLIVMGAYGHSRLREQILGGATRGVIGSCPLPVLMSH
jgi:nucleotide-binding universal stress UspA family protein